MVNLKQNQYQRWIDRLSQTPENEKQGYIYETLKFKELLHIFARWFFPRSIKCNNDIADCHKELVAEVARKENSAVVFPRGFGKTTWLKIDTIHDIVYELEPVIVYISNTITSAQFHFESIKAELENNDLLKSIYGDLTPEQHQGTKWHNTHFEATNGVNVVARGACKGRGVNIKGQRPTKIVGDDIEDDDMVRSVDRRRKLHEWLYNVILPSLDRDVGYVKLIGTNLHPECELFKFYEKFGGTFKSGEDEQGESIWQDGISTEQLQKLKKILGARAYAQEIMNDPVDESVALLHRAWIYDNMYNSLPKDTRKQNATIMFDPQAGEKAGADYYGLAVVGWWNRDNHRYLLEIQKGHKSQLDQAALIVRTFQRYKETHNVKVVGVEKIMTQVAVYQLILDWKSGRIDLDGVDNSDRNIPIIAVEPKGKDKKARMEMHQSAFERGEIHLHSSMNNFAYDLIRFPDLDHDDDIDAFIYALEWSYKSMEGRMELSSGKESAKTMVGNIIKQQF